jgi:hypothetical protein
VVVMRELWRKLVIRCGGLCGVRLAVPRFCPVCYVPLCAYCRCPRCGRQGR